MMSILRALLCVLATASVSPAFSATNFAARPEVRAFVTEMHEKHGFAAGKLLRAFARVKPIPAVIKAIMPPRDPTIRSWQAYRARFVEPTRIALGLEFWRQHRDALAAAHDQTGVPEEIVVAIIGIESIYGRHTGNFVTLAALATLAFDYPHADPLDDPLKASARARMFRGQLEELLLLARETHRNPLSYSGSYAGALGLPQFLPGSVRRYAVDGDHDGRIDLAASPDDAIASVAHFLKMHGWETGGPLAVPASVEGEGFASLIAEGIVPRLTPREMAAYGVASDDAPELPATLIDLVTPRQPIEYRLGFRNFYALTRYNRSSFYAMAVIDLAHELRAGLSPPQ